MEPTTDHRVQAWRWLATPEGAALIDETTPDPSVAQIASLRNRWDAPRVHAAIELVRARERARAKFGDRVARNLWSDDEGVQMASSPRAAAHKAGRFGRILGEHARVADLCCGIGGDLMGMTHAGLDAYGVDADPSRAWMAAKNTGRETLAADALDDRIAIGPFHLDPGRREGGRTRDISAYAPPPDVWDALIAKHGTGCVKLNPGVRADDLPEGEIEILSERGRLTQALVWTGALETARRRATLLTDTGTVTIEGEPERTDDQHEIGDWIATIDPSVERADLIPTLLTETGSLPVHPGTGLVTGSEPIDHPMLAWFRVLDAFKFDERAATSVLAAHGAGSVEIKTRDKLVDPDALQRRLARKILQRKINDTSDPAARDDQTLTLFVMRFGRRPQAILARRTPRPAGEHADTPTHDTGAIPC